MAGAIVPTEEAEGFKDYAVICNFYHNETKYWEFEGYHKQPSSLDKEIFSSLSIKPDDYHIYCQKELLAITDSSVCAIDGEYVHGMFFDRPESTNWLYLKGNNGAIHHIRKDFIMMIAIGRFFLFKKKYMIRVEEREIQE